MRLWLLVFGLASAGSRRDYCWYCDCCGLERSGEGGVLGQKRVNCNWCEAAEDGEELRVVDEAEMMMRCD